MYFHYMIIMEPHPNTMTPKHGDMKFTILMEAFLLIMTMSLISFFNTQKQSSSFSKNKCIFTMNSMEPRPNTMTPDPGDMKFKILVEAILLIMTMYLVSLFNT